jgi:hypothetical protein
MPIVFDEVTAEVQPPAEPARGTAPWDRQPAGAAAAELLDLTRLLEQLAERAARIDSD